MRHPLELPKSDAFAGVEWLAPRVPYPVETVRGDTFPVTWGADGELYAGAGDPLWGADLAFSDAVREVPRTGPKGQGSVTRTIAL